MEDIKDEGLNATANETTTVETAPVDAVAAESSAVEEPKKLSIDEAVSEAFKKHTEKPSADPASKLVAGDIREVTPDGKQIDPVTGRELEPIKAPSSWTPGMREKWGSIDPQMQKFITDREYSIQQGMSKTAEERTLGKTFRDVLSPYEGMFKQYGISGVDHVKELLTQSKILNTGTAQEKAHVLYGFINHFKPDPHTLTALFNGQLPGPTAAPRPQVDPQAEVQRILAERENEATTNDVQSHMDTFANNPAHEFFHDVRETMGKVIDAGLVDGDTLPALFKNAYDMACANHPEVRQILASRQATTVQQAPVRSPVGSVKPSLGTGRQAMGRPKSMSLDEALSEAARRHGLK